MAAWTRCTRPPSAPRWGWSFIGRSSARRSPTSSVGRAGSYQLIGTSARGQTDYRRVERYVTPLVLLLGTEREGLTASQMTACDALVRLPMHGRVTSLNLAIAAGVMLYTIHDSLDAQGLLPG